MFRYLPQWWAARLYQRFRLRASSGVKLVPVRPHGYLMELRLDDPMDRFTYYVGRFWSLDVVEFVWRASYETFVDVGANVGYLTLTAARKAKQVHAFEPMPALANRLTDAVRLNGLTNVQIHRCALGDKPGSLRFSVSDHHSKNNLRGVGSGPEVSVCRADDVLDVGPSLVKIDVEGFELRALCGMKKLLANGSTFLVEIDDEFLRECGDSAEALFDFMQERGYKAFKPRLTMFGHLKLDPVTFNHAPHFDAVFIME